MNPADLLPVLWQHLWAFLLTPVGQALTLVGSGIVISQVIRHIVRDRRHREELRQLAADVAYVDEQIRLGAEMDATAERESY